MSTDYLGISGDQTSFFSFGERCGRRSMSNEWLKRCENESSSIKVAQLVQWGGAPTSLVRDTELSGHAKRSVHGTPCTSHIPSNLSSRLSFPSWCTRFAHTYACMQRPLPVVSLETSPARPATGNARCLRDAPGCVSTVLFGWFHAVTSLGRVRGLETGKKNRWDGHDEQNL